MKKILLLVVIAIPTLNTFAQGTAFTYQGRLNNDAAPANGIYDLSFVLFQYESGGPPILGPITNVAVTVSNGLFTAMLDFGPFDPNAYLRGRWLEISVRTNGGGSFTTLAPRQPMTPAPSAIYATYALNASPGGGFNADSLDGLDSNDLWKLGGNAGTIPGTHFLGTTDNQALEFKVNGLRALRLEPGIPDGFRNAPNVIGGSSLNSVAASVVGATVAGGGANYYFGLGGGNAVNGDFGTVAGGVLNVSSKFAATVGGGWYNTSSGTNATIGGGYYNTADANNATVSGGNNNTSIGYGATVGGGEQNVSKVDWATVAGGYQNSSTNAMATIGGGGYNISSGGASTVSGGVGNRATEYTATVPGGYFNVAGGQYSFAAGQFAKALHDGTFVWADYTSGDFASTSYNQFLIRAGGGVGIGVTAPQQQLSVAAGINLDQNNANAGTVASALTFGSSSGEAIASKRTPGGNQFGLDFYTASQNRLSIANNGNVNLASSSSLFFGNTLRQMLNFYNASYGIGVQDYTLYSRCDNTGSPNDGFIWYRGGVHNNNYANAGGGTEMMHLVPGGLYVNGALVVTSDRNAKENFTPVEPREVLEKVVALPITRWNYKHDAATPHLGPVAQDFYAAFGVGPDGQHIATVDADGVALAAIQGLNGKVETSERKTKSRLDQLETELQRREAENAGLKARLERLEHLLHQRLTGSAK